MSKLSSYPNMYPEILEAIHLMYEDHPDVEVDCLLYLTELRDNWTRTAELSNQAINKLEEMGRCPYCGEPMQVYHYQEPHPELDGYPMENMSEPYCPNCDTNVGGWDD